MLVILPDVKLPDGHGPDLIPRRRAKITLLTAYSTITHAVTPMKRGAFDYLIKGDSDDPYTRTFSVTHILPQELVRIDFCLGFRVDQAINYMFGQVITDLVQNDEIDTISRYVSLYEQERAGEFRAE